MEDPDLRSSLKIFLATEHASQDVYNKVHDSIHERFPDCHFLSLHQVKRPIAEFTGVVPILNDICPNSCLAYVGLWSELDRCPKCGEDRYENNPGDTKTSRQHFYMIPVGPQLQALWTSPKGAEDIKYCQQCTSELLAELQESEGNIPLYDNICGLLAKGCQWRNN